MLVLAVDTSLPILSVAITLDDALVGAMALEGKGSRNEKLLPAVDWLLAENGIDRRSVDLFAATRGPGSFTGVRIGLATIQGLALALGRPVCAMSTHEAAAHGEAGSVLIVDDAGRGEHYVSLWRDGAESVAPRLATGAELEAIRGTAGTLQLGELMQRDCIALRCARRAAEIHSRGMLDRYCDATPIYVRLAEAEVRLQQKRDA